MSHIPSYLSYPYYYPLKVDSPARKWINLLEGVAPYDLPRLIDQINAAEAALPEDQESLLNILLSQGKEELALTLINNGYRLLERPSLEENRFPQHQSPIHRAINILGSVELLMALHKRGVSLESPVSSDPEMNPLSFCFGAEVVTDGHLECLKYLVNSLPNDSLFGSIKVGPFRMPLTEASCIYTHPSWAVFIMLKRGEARDDHKVLHYLLRSDAKIELIHKAIELGCNVNHLDTIGVSLEGINLISPLHRLVLSKRSDKKELIELLVSSGADMHQRSVKGMPMFESMFLGGNMTALEAAARSDQELAKYMLTLSKREIIPTMHQGLPHVGDFMNGSYEDPAYILMNLQGKNVPTTIVQKCLIDEGIDTKKMEAVIRSVESCQDPLVEDLLALVNQLGNVEVYACHRAKSEDPSFEDVKGFFQMINPNKVVVLDGDDAGFLAEAVVHELGHLVDHHYGLQQELKEDLLRAYDDYKRMQDQFLENSNFALDLHMQVVFDSMEQSYKPCQFDEELIARTLQLSFKINQIDPQSSSRLRIQPLIDIVGKALKRKQTRPFFLKERP